MAIENDFDTVAGTKLYVSATLPTVSTGAGAAEAFALLTWIEVGSITNVGGVKGRSYNTSELKTVGDAQNRKKKGSFSLPDAQFECAWIEDDDGQIIIEAGANSYDTLAFKVVKQDTVTTRYFTAQVMEFLENGGGSDDAVLGNFTLLRQTDTVTA